MTEEARPDLDAVRHVNQFGTPDEPMMEMSCVPEKVDAVRAFLEDNGTDTWPTNINPLRIPSVQPTDTSPAAVKKGAGHLTRVILSWWKDANFVQSTDTSLYYQRLIMQVVQGQDALHQWPSYITGINIDARGVTDAKGTPIIFFDYAEGIDPPQIVSGTNRKPKAHMRSISTGGAPPTNQPVKRQRQVAKEPAVRNIQGGAQTDTQAMNDGDKTEPAAPAAPGQDTATPDTRKARQTLAFNQIPLKQFRPNNEQLSAYFPAGATGAGPSTPAAEKSVYNHIQVSASSGRKLHPLDPRAVAKQKGMDGQ